MQFHTILTHESPDLDAIFCCYLLLQHGEKRYPGISSARIEFCPAGRLPGEKTPEQLEAEGILPVDIGGGRLDTHPDGSFLAQEKRFLAASDLVAKDLDVDTMPTLQNLLQFARLQDSSGTSISSRNPLDHLVVLPSLIRGGLLYFGQDFKGMVQFFMKALQAIEMSDILEPHHETFGEEANSLIALGEDCVWISSQPTLQAIFAAYLAKRFLQKDIQFVSGTQMKCMNECYNLNNFMESVKLVDNIEIAKIKRFVEELRPGQFLLGSDAPIDQTVSLPNIINGLWKCHDKKIALDLIFVLFDSIVAYEQSWIAAIQEYPEKRQLIKVNKTKVVAIVSENGNLPKVARWQDKADVVVFQDPQTEHVSITLNRLGRMKLANLKTLAAKIRTAEILLGGSEPLPPDSLFEIGEIAAWFLHQSEKLLVHGSPKAKRNPPRLPFDLVVDLVVSDIERQKKLPDRICPPNACTHSECLFYELRLSNCFAHRQSLR